MGRSGGFTNSLACYIFNWSSSCGSIREVICSILLTTLHSSGASIYVPSLGLLRRAKAYSIHLPYAGDVCPVDPPFVGVVFLRHQWVVLVRSDGVPTRKDNISDTSLI